MLPNRDGKFNAYPLTIGVDETGPNNLATVIVAYSIKEEFANGEWVDVSSEGMEITGYHYIEKKDGSLNESTIKSLKASFGWGGTDPFWFADSQDVLREHPVQLVLDWEEYNGKNRLKIKYVNPYGSEGGVSNADDATRRSMASRLGSKLRAISGAPVPAAKPTGKPAVPTGSKPAARPPVKAPAAPAAKTATADEAWAAVQARMPEGWAQEDQEAEWWRIVGLVLPGVDTSKATPEQWGKVVAEGPGQVIPM